MNLEKLGAKMSISIPEGRFHVMSKGVCRELGTTPVASLE